jgi:hypothetical protein
MAGAGEFKRICLWSFWVANLVRVSSTPVSCSACTAAVVSTKHTGNANLLLCSITQLVDAVYVIMAWASATNLANVSCLAVLHIP